MDILRAASPGSTLLWSGVTILVYAACRFVFLRTRSPLLHPGFTGIVAMVVILELTGRHYADFQVGTAWINWLLGPAVVAMAVPIYQLRNVVRANRRTLAVVVPLGMAFAPVLLLGAPGVGKGTQAQLLMAAFGIPQISTGDLLRDHVQKGTELGRTAKALMDDGKLVSDEIVNSMVADRLQREDTLKGYVLDGFPRTEGQATWLDSKLPELHDTPPLIAIKIHVPTEELLRRITGRRTCPTCNRIYNIYTHPPAVQSLCDFDGTPLQHRSDDTEAAFYKRMTEFELKTAPVIDHYRVQNCFREIEGSGSQEEVEQRIIYAVHDLRTELQGAR